MYLNIRSKCNHIIRECKCYIINERFYLKRIYHFRKGMLGQIEAKWAGVGFAEKLKLVYTQ